MNEQAKERLEAMPTNPSDHYRIKPRFDSPRKYYFKQLLNLISTAKKDYILPLALNNKIIKIGDYGCGTKPYQSVLSHPNIDYLGIDLAWNPHADIYLNPDFSVAYHDSGLDILLSTQVLEHVEDPDFYLTEGYRLLKKDGLLLLTTHGYWMYHPDPTDYWRWTSAGLKKVVERNGFEIIAFSGIIGRASMGLQLFQDGLLFKIPRWSWALITIPLQFFIWLFDQINAQKTIDQDACTYLVVARKK